MQRMMTTCLFMKMERKGDVRRDGNTAAKTWGIVSPVYIRLSGGVGYR